LRSTIFTKASGKRTVTSRISPITIS